MNYSARRRGTDKLPRRKFVAVLGYVVTAFGTAAIGLGTTAWHVLLARSAAWLGRGVRTPVRKALLASAVTRETYGRAFGFERMLDTLGAIVGPATALWLLGVFDYHYPSLFAVTLVPGLLAVGVIVFLVAEKKRTPVPHISFGDRLRMLPAAYRRFLVAVGLFGAGDFAHTLLIDFWSRSRLTGLVSVAEWAPRGFLASMIRVCEQGPALAETSSLSCVNKCFFEVQPAGIAQRFAQARRKVS